VAAKKSDPVGEPATKEQFVAYDVLPRESLYLGQGVLYVVGAVQRETTNKATRSSGAKIVSTSRGSTRGG
jgi:hypothetical protein